MNKGVYNRCPTIEGALTALRRDIILYRYPDGHKVTELKLMADYECSRAAVRAALTVLEKEGLIIARPNGTKAVATLSNKDVNDLYRLRAYIESEAAADAHDLSHAAAVLARAENASVEQLMALDSEFHTALVAASRNKALINAWTNIAPVIDELIRLNMTAEADRTWFKDTFDSRHRLLLAEILAGRGRKATAAHVEEAREISLRSIQ